MTFIFRTKFYDNDGKYSNGFLIELTPALTANMAKTSMNIIMKQVHVPCTTSQMGIFGSMGHWFRRTEPMVMLAIGRASAIKLNSHPRRNIQRRQMMLPLPLWI
jgi:hypothetical protein